MLQVAGWTFKTAQISFCSMYQTAQPNIATESGEGRELIKKGFDADFEYLGGEVY